MNGIITLICFLSLALIELFNAFLILKLEDNQIISESTTIILTSLEYTFLTIALILSIKSLFYKDDTPKISKFLYLTLTSMWITVKIVETLENLLAY